MSATDFDAAIHLTAALMVEESEFQFDCRDLRYFTAAAEHGSFRKAGIALHVQESTISRRIRDLEDRLGVSLFHRNNRGVVLTFGGQRFLRRVRVIVEQVRDSVQDLAAVGRGEEGQVRVGLSCLLASSFLTTLFRAYDRNHSRVHIDFVDGSAAAHAVAVGQLELDVAFLAGTPVWPDCEIASLWSERILAVLPENHRLAAFDDVEWLDLLNETFIVNEADPGHLDDYLIHRFAGLGRRPKIHAQTVGRDNLLSLVAMGRGVVLISETGNARHPGLVYRLIRDETIPVNAIWSRRNDNPALRRLLSMAKKLSAEAYRRGDGEGC